MLYEKIEQLCKEHGISIAKLESNLGFGNATIRGWKESQPYLGNIQKVAEYFGVDVNVFIDRNIK